MGYLSLRRQVWKAQQWLGYVSSASSSSARLSGRGRLFRAKVEMAFRYLSCCSPLGGRELRAVEETSLNEDVQIREHLWPISEHHTNRGKDNSYMSENSTNTDSKTNHRKWDISYLQKWASWQSETLWAAACSSVSSLISIQQSLPHCCLFTQTGFHCPNVYRIKW